MQAELRVQDDDDDDDDAKRCERNLLHMRGGFIVQIMSEGLRLG